ncbi:MAG: hypothetical protein ACI9XO_004875 [Paraglaciecola sp.]|jgi:hypothetical protein
MKNLLFVFILIPMLSFATNPVDGLSAISQAISAGDADALGTYFDAQVEISVLDNEDYYSKTEAVAVVKKFFAQHKPQSFKEMHQGTSKGKDSQYCIGNLVANGGTFRVYVYMKNSGAQPVIQELRFDKE